MNLEMMKNLYDIDCDVHKFPDGTILYKFKNPPKDKKSSCNSAILFYIKTDRISVRLEQTKYVETKYDKKTKKTTPVNKQFTAKTGQFHCISFKRNQCNFYQGQRLKKRSRQFHIWNLKNMLPMFKQSISHTIACLYADEITYDMFDNIFGKLGTAEVKKDHRLEPMIKFIMDQMKQKFSLHGRQEEWKKFCEA